MVLQYYKKESTHTNQIIVFCHFKGFVACKKNYSAYVKFEQKTKYLKVKNKLKVC